MLTDQKISYQENLKQLREQLKGMLPEAALSTFDTDAAQLQKEYKSVLKVKLGDKAPDFQLPNATKKIVRRDALLEKGKIVLVFYRGNWCPYCNLQLSIYQKLVDEFKASGATLVAISPQTPDQSLSMQEKHNLAFEVLSDIGNKVARQYTTIFKFGEEPLTTMAELGYDFSSFYGDDSKEIPIPAVFVINEKGIITFAKSEGGDYRNRVEPEEILKALTQ